MGELTPQPSFEMGDRRRRGLGRLLVASGVALALPPAHAATVRPNAERTYSSGNLRAAIPDGGVLERSVEILRDVVATTRARKGAVRAEVGFRAPFLSNGVRLRIFRGGVRRLDVALRPGYANPIRLLVRDLDGDRDPEVIVDVYTNGAHCCTISLLYRWLPAAGRYKQTVASWGNFGYRLIDLDRNRVPELSAFDERFLYLFTAFADSVAPIRVLRFDHGLLRNVTLDFPGAVQRDADTRWRQYTTLRGDRRRSMRGILAAWMADMALLGREDEGWRQLDLVYRRGDLRRGYDSGSARTYLSELRAFLKKTGYIRAGG